MVQPYVSYSLQSGSGGNDFQNTTNFEEDDAMSGFVGLYYQDATILTVDSDNDWTQVYISPASFNQRVFDGTEVFSSIGVHGKSGSLTEARGVELGLYESDAPMDGLGIAGTLVAQESLLFPQANSTTPSDTKLPYSLPISYNAVAGKYYSIGVVSSQSTAIKLSTDTGIVDTWVRDAADVNGVLDATFGATVGPSSNNLRFMVMWAEWAVSSGSSPTLSTSYSTQYRVLNDAISFSVATWTGVTSDGYGAINLPVGLEISPQGLITGNLRMGGIIGTTITVTGTDGSVNSAGFNWYITLT